jgi:hypothetical protein
MPYEAFKKSLPEGFIDLGEKLKPIDLGNNAMDETEYHYPSLFFTDAKGLKNLPKEGTATIYFKKVMEREESTTRAGKTENRHSVELCICGIKPNGESVEEEEDDEEMDDEDEIEKGLSESEQKTKPKIEIEIES